MDQRTTPSALSPDTIDTILAERLDPKLRAAQARIMDVLALMGTELSIEMQAQLHDALTDTLTTVYHQGLRDARLTLVDLLDG